MVSSFEVVVVSSDLVVRHHLARVLASLGVDPVCVSTLRECHAILAQKTIQLVFCNSQVADGNYQDLLAAYPQPGAKPRVVVTSASADWDEYKVAMRCGAFDLISVPCRRTEVEWMVIQAKRVESGADTGVEAPELAKGWH